MMTEASVQRKLVVVGLNAARVPSLHPCKMALTLEQAVDGDVIERAKADARRHGLDDPMLVFDQNAGVAEHFRQMADWLLSADPEPCAEPDAEQPSSRSNFRQELMGYGFELISTGGGFTAWQLKRGTASLLLTDQEQTDASKLRRDDAMVLGRHDDGQGDEIWNVEGPWECVRPYIHSFLQGVQFRRPDWIGPPRACPFCGSTALIEVGGWKLMSLEEPDNTCEGAEYQCQGACEGRSFWC